MFLNGSKGKGVKEAEWWMKEIIEEVKAELLDEWKGKRKFCHCQRAERIENRKTVEIECSEGRFKKTGVVMQKKTKYKYENKKTKMEIRASEVKVW